MSSASSALVSNDKTEGSLQVKGIQIWSVTQPMIRESQRRTENRN